MATPVKSASTWSAKAVHVRELLPKTRFHPAVLRQIEQVRARGPWCIAFSGGADSLALVLALKAHWPEQPWLALHFNHRLRGKASDGDAVFCRKVCRSLGIEFALGAWRRPPKSPSEGESRVARHAFFAKTMKLRRSRILWLAHQQDDIAESMLMRLARGSGAGGLAAPRPVQVFGDKRIFLRPLLTIKKAELVETLQAAKCEWREDETNVRADFFRNRVRGAVIPAWQQAAGRDALAGASLSRELLDEDDQALELWVDRLKVLQRGVLNLNGMSGVPRAVLRRALHRWLLAVNPQTDLSRRGFELLLSAARLARPTRFSLGASDFAVIKGGNLSLRKG